MIESVLKQFAGSSEAAKIVSDLQKKHDLTPEQAQGAVAATAEGAAEQAKRGGLASMLGKGGVAGAVSKMMGGGGMTGATVGGDGGGPSAQLIDTVAQTRKTGLSADMAKKAVSFVLPKVIDYAKSKMS